MNSRLVILLFLEETNDLIKQRSSYTCLANAKCRSFKLTESQCTSCAKLIMSNFVSGTSNIFGLEIDKLLALISNEINKNTRSSKAMTG